MMINIKYDKHTFFIFGVLGTNPGYQDVMQKDLTIEQTYVKQGSS